MKYANLLVSCICLLIFRLEITLAYAATSTTDAGPSQALIKQAKELEIEPNVLMELWNSKQPVIVTKPDATGQMTRTTYELTSDGLGITQTVSKESPPVQQASQSTHQQSSQQSPQQDWEYLPPTQTRRVSFQGFQPSPNFGASFNTNFGANWPDFSSGFPSLSPNWPSFSFPAGVVPQTSTKTEVDDQGRTVTTTTKIYRSNVDPNQQQPTLFSQPLPSWLQPTPQRPGLGTNVDQPGVGLANSGPTTPPVVKIEPTFVPLPTVAPTSPSFVSLRTTTPFPSLEEFQRRQNPANTITNINLDNLPTINEQGVPNFNNVPETQTRTRVTTYSSNFNGDSAPKISNLDPSAQEILVRAGITEEDIRNAPPNGIIERTRTDPDGRLVTTRIRINSSPSVAPTGILPSVPLPTPKSYVPPTPVNEDKSIENYLSQVNLSPSDILAQNGEVVKTIVDKDGRVLSARFVLSTVKASENLEHQEMPTK